MQATPPPSGPGTSLLRGRRRLQIRWERLHMDVRCALHADEPMRIRQYLQCGNKLVALGVLDDVAAQARMLQTLLCTASDTALPNFWRSACLELTPLPLRRLRGLIGLHDPLAMLAIETAVGRRDQRFALLCRHVDVHV